MMLLLWFAAAFGFAFVVGHSKISLPFREWFGGKLVLTETTATSPGAAEAGITMSSYAQRKAAVPYLGPFLVALAECPGCLGWWLGLGAAFFWPALVPFGLSLWASMLLLAFATSGVNLLLARYVGMV